MRSNTASTAWSSLDILDRHRRPAADTWSAAGSGPARRCALHVEQDRIAAVVEQEIEQVFALRRQQCGIEGAGRASATSMSLLISPWRKVRERRRRRGARPRGRRAACNGASASVGWVPSGSGATHACKETARMGKTISAGAPPALDLDRCALFLDYDGTLVDLAPTPAEAVADAELRELLAALQVRLDRRAGHRHRPAGRGHRRLSRTLAPDRRRAARPGARAGMTAHRHRDGPAARAAGTGAAGAGRASPPPIPEPWSRTSV